jgi:hypothetical protein
VTITPELSTNLKGSVLEAIEQIEQAYPSLPLKVVPDGQGGAWVELTDVPLGTAWQQSTTFLIFLLPFNLPACDIYPMFVRPDLQRSGHGGLVEGLAVTQLSWPGDPSQRDVVQVSRRTRGSFAAQTAPQKVEKVMDWVRSQ